jgi:hypothetical protein
MDLFIALLLAVLALGLGIWIGVGAPGWNHRPQYTRRHTAKRGLNPIGWGRTTHATRRRR